jgi:nucleotidyltransferase/DNA polymerase involved in DNA repair
LAVLAMWVPEMPFQMAGQQDPGLRERPLAFLAPGPQRTPCLWLVNRLARAEGLAAGDPMDHALRRVPGLRVLDPAPQTWWEAQASLGEFLQHWTPQGLLGHMGEALVELDGTGRLFGGPRDAAARIQRELAQSTGWVSQGGLSRSATAAKLATRLEHTGPGARLEEVAEGAEPVFLAPHPLGRMPDLAPRLRWRFQRLGLRRFGDLQPVPLPTLAQLMPDDQARRVLAQARGEDRPRLPMLADPVGESRHPWRLEPPCLPEEVPLAMWCLERFWNDGRTPRRLTLRWWDVDGLDHRWRAPEELLAEPAMVLARQVEAAFRRGAVRRILVHRLELHLAWGLGRPRGLFEAPLSRKLGALEPALARLRRRFPDRLVLPGWAMPARGGMLLSP